MSRETVAPVCPHCGEDLPGLGTYCWICSRYVDETDAPKQPQELPPPSEEEVQAEIADTLRRLDAAVYDTSQPHRALITPGLPDLLVFHEERFAFVEVKRPGKEMNLSDAQEAFRRYCREAGIEHYVWSSEAPAYEWVTGKRTANQGGELNG